MLMTPESRLLCPVDGCDWQLDPEAGHEAARYVMPASPTPEDISTAIGEVANRRAAKVEAAVREHLESHDVLDFMRTIRRLEQDLYQQHSGIRPHLYMQGPTKAWKP